MQKAIFEIFRAGTHSKGGGIAKNITWTKSHLADLVKFYDETTRPAPLTIGHPQNDEPKLGVVKRLIQYNNSIFAETEVADELIQRIKNNEISGISIAIFGEGHFENPLGTLGNYLKHVGFLERGKQEPAVEGMLDPKISVDIFHYSSNEEIVMFCENEQIPLKEQLDAKISYFQSVLGTDYKTAFNIVIQTH